MEKSKRLVSLDVFRGMAIASMILVNNPGSWSHVYPPLLHAEWDGFTPTDLVFPAFLFIAGAAMAFSLRKYLDPENTHSEQLTAKVYWRIARRCGLLFLLGLLLNGFPTYNLPELRIMGVLQRIAVAYFCGAMAVLHLSRKWLWGLSVFILVGYWLLMTLIPVPGIGAGELTPDGNFAAYLDRLVLGVPHLYKQANFDPEGLFSTLPAVVTVLFGYFTGDWLRDRPQKSRTSLGLVAFGISGLLLGSLWGAFFPINKQLWTSSYVLYSAGWSLLLLAFCYELIEVRNIKRWAFPFKVMGLNAIFVFVISGFVVRILYRTKIGTGDDAPSTYSWLYQTLFEPWAGSLNGSLLFAIASVLFWWIILYFMYRQRWFIKI
ncbi:MULTISPECIES: heparan-alpha-glucosaminide N-acetyltransferase domain-containing protein [Spirulina sp. CCY15215]|uniref:acyltransferase family protein n=1 Tax=Spirulina sp. CCY15215 TaxID=2767591 RepID=UPI001951DBEE|nr:heparan-alpha-glucosaminide N-acetyltransferase domain-containing protein [Spirulina major]